MIHLGPRGAAHRGLEVTELRIRPVFDPINPRMLAYVNLTLNDAIALYGCRIVMVGGRAVLFMPDHKRQDGERFGRAFPVSQATRSWLERIVFAAYREAIEATANRVMETPA